MEQLRRTMGQLEFMSWAKQEFGRTCDLAKDTVARMRATETPVSICRATESLILHAKVAQCQDHKKKIFFFNKLYLCLCRAV